MVGKDQEFQIRIERRSVGRPKGKAKPTPSATAVAENPLRRSLWQVDSSVVETERAFEAVHDPVWYRVESESRRNAIANPTSFHIALGHSDVSILTADEPQQQRAAFSGAPLWVTRYDPEETFAAGTYPNQNRAVEGLPVYVGNREPIRNEDLVVWFTVGFRHQTRAEDWPVMSGLWHSFRLRPFNFFDRNPGVDVPSVPEQAE